MVVLIPHVVDDLVDDPKEASINAYVMIVRPYTICYMSHNKNPKCTPFDAALHYAITPKRNGTPMIVLSQMLP